MNKIPLKRISGLAASAMLVVAAVGVGTPAQATHVTQARTSGGTVTLDTQLTGSVGESGRPTPFVAVVDNPAAARTNVRYSFRFRPFHELDVDFMRFCFDIDIEKPFVSGLRRFGPESVSIDENSGRL